MISVLDGHKIEPMLTLNEILPAYRRRPLFLIRSFQRRRFLSHVTQSDALLGLVYYNGIHNGE